MLGPQASLAARVDRNQVSYLNALAKPPIAPPDHGAALRGQGGPPAVPAPRSLIIFTASGPATAVIFRDLLPASCAVTKSRQAVALHGRAELSTNMAVTRSNLCS